MECLQICINISLQHTFAQISPLRKRSIALQQLATANYANDCDVSRAGNLQATQPDSTETFLLLRI